MTCSALRYGEYLLICAVVALPLGGCKKAPSNGSKISKKAAAAAGADMEAALPAEMGPAAPAMNALDAMDTGQAEVPATARPAGGASDMAEPQMARSADDAGRHGKVLRPRARKGASGKTLTSLQGHTVGLFGGSTMSGKGAGAGGGGSGMWGGFSGMGSGLGGKGLGGMAPARKPKVHLRSAKVMGGLSTSALKRVIRRRLAGVKYCYISVGLPRNPKLAGNMTIAFAIAANGRVTMATLRSSSLGSSAVAGCVKRTVLRMVFPKPKSSTMATASFSFKP